MNAPSSDHPDRVKTATQARQGRTTGHVRWILRISMVLAVIGMVVAYWLR